MRYVSFLNGAGAPTAGVVVQGLQAASRQADDGHPDDLHLDNLQVADLSHASCAGLLGGVPPTLQALIDSGLQGWTDRLGSVSFDAAALRPLASVQLLAPVRPGKVVGAAFNFHDALAERGMAAPAEPVVFVRSGRTVIGPGDAIQLPPDVGNVGYEAELAVVIGRRALAVSRETALQYVAGYTAHNDVSGSTLVKLDGGNFVRGKNLPASSPLGPWLLTPDALPDPQHVRVQLSIDGRALQDGTTATMVFDVAALISFISQRMPLDPGDVIATGTPAGVAAMHQPEAWLQPGQMVTVAVQGFGILQNPVIAGPPFLTTL